MCWMLSLVDVLSHIDVHMVFPTGADGHLSADTAGFDKGSLDIA